VNSDFDSGNVVTAQFSTYWEIIFIYLRFNGTAAFRKYTFYHYSIFQGHTVHTWENYSTRESTV
jgi:hypothetical protein